MAIHLLHPAGPLRTDRGHGRRPGIRRETRFALHGQRRHGAAGIGRHHGTDRSVCPRQRTVTPHHLPLQLRRTAVENGRKGALRPGAFLHGPHGRHHRKRGLRTDVGMAYSLGARVLSGESLVRRLFVRQSDLRTGDPEPARRFVITTENNSRENIYIQQAELNGRPWPFSYIPYGEIVRGGSLHFVMGPTPNRAFGSAPSHRPYNEIR